MIDIRKLKELVRLMVSNDLTELDLRDSEEQVTLRRASVNAAPQVMTHMVPASQHGVSVPVASGHAASPSGNGSGGQQHAATATAAPPAHAAIDDEDGLIRIESPMVGTFYTAPNPDSPPFVEIGAEVNPDTVVCIIEAMKIFNEIKAECSGTIQKVLVKNAESVEFGQPLFLVKPD
jgi:acetyl-CoA carboxylase biotin carboxyl carrier protein